MTKPARVQPKGDYIKQLIAESGRTPESFANEEPTIDIKLVRKAIKGEPSTPKTISTIAKKLGLKGVVVTFNDLIEVQFSPAAIDVQLSAPAAGDQPTQTPILEVQFSVKFLADFDKLHGIAPESIKYALASAVSEFASAQLKKLREGSVCIDCVSEKTVRDRLLQCLIRGELQKVGGYEIRFVALPLIAQELVVWAKDARLVPLAETWQEIEFISALTPEPDGARPGMYFRFWNAAAHSLVRIGAFAALGDPLYFFSLDSSLATEHISAAEHFWKNVVIEEARSLSRRSNRPLPKKPRSQMPHHDE